MATERDDEVVSDTETQEGPVREQLKKASISKASGAVKVIAADTAAENSEDSGDNGDSSSPRGRLHKKRSIDDVEGEQAQDSTSESALQHNRKRSRDSTVEEDELNNGQRKSGERTREVAEPETHSTSNGHPTVPTSERPRTPELAAGKRGEAAVESMTSPKSKRSRLHSGNNEHGANDVESATAATKEDAAAKIPSSSGFANTSAASPFASLSGSKSPSAEQQTSTSAFAASGFSSLSGSNSGFGAIGKTSGGFGTGGGFATGNKSASSTAEATAPRNEDESSKTASGSTFGGALGQKSAFGGTGAGSNGSAFGSGTQGFGKPGGSSGFGGSMLGGGGGAGFGSIGGGGGLTSFASGKPSASLSSSQTVKPFGTPGQADDEDEEGGDGEDESGFKSPLSQESDKQDERFYHQDLETGEEDEVTDYSCRAKLYNFASVAEGKKEWKERGLGVVRLNVKKPFEDDDSKPTARLLMRADGSHRVILNTQVKKEIKFGAPTGGPPTSGFLYFMGAVDGKQGLELLQLKVRQQFALELYEKVVELQEAM